MKKIEKVSQPTRGYDPGHGAEFERGRHVPIERGIHLAGVVQREYSTSRIE